MIVILTSFKVEKSCESAGADVGALQRWAGQGDDGERGGGGDNKKAMVIRGHQGKDSDLGR